MEKSNKKAVMLNSFQHPLHFLHASKVEILNKFQDDNMITTARAFTLIELMVAVIIIAVLAAVAVPQYKKAVLKSRYSTLMPVANSLAKGNEVYYLANGEYAKQENKLDVEGQVSTPEGTEITLETDPEYLSYVRVSNTTKVPNARYVVYQQHSANFAGTTMCEAKDDTAKELCKGLGGVFVSDNGTESEWTAYLLSGNLGVGDSFEVPCPDNSTTCDDKGKATECESGYYVSGGACAACPANSTCDNDGEITGCKTGYSFSGNACVDTRINCPKDKEAFTTATGATCTQVCEDQDNPDCYKWNGGATLSSYCYGYAGPYSCAGATYVKIDNNHRGYCEGHSEYACAYSIFKKGTTCTNYPTVAGNTCVNSKFIGAKCIEQGFAGACTGSVFTEHSSCTGHVEGSCVNLKYDETSGCDGSYCPAGSPRVENDFRTMQPEFVGWNAGYCDPSFMISGKCPSGSPTQSGNCWDGTGNEIPCS